MIESSQNWKKTLLKPSDTMQDAINILAVGGLRIALVIDAKERLLGTITDGDVRRALIRNSSLIVSVDGIMNSNPMTASDKDDEQHIQKILLENDILQVPVINSKGRVVGLKTFTPSVADEDKKQNFLSNYIFLIASECI